MQISNLAQLQAYQKLFQELSTNEEQFKYNHKQLRSYGRCLLRFLPSLSIDTLTEHRLYMLITVYSSGGIPHYDRAFLASEISDILLAVIAKKHNIIKNECF